MNQELKKQIEILRTKVIKRKTLYNKEYEENEKNFHKLQNLLLKYIFEENLLLQSTWEFDDYNFRLIASEEDFPELTKIMREISDADWGYHYGITLEDFSKDERFDKEKLELRCDDGDLSIIIIGNNEKLIHFIKYHKLKITTKNIDRKIENKSEELKLLKKIKDYINE